MLSEIKQLLKNSTIVSQSIEQLLSEKQELEQKIEKIGDYRVIISQVSVSKLEFLKEFYFSFMSK